MKHFFLSIIFLSLVRGFSLFFFFSHFGGCWGVPACQRGVPSKGAHCFRRVPGPILVLQTPDLFTIFSYFLTQSKITWKEKLWKLLYLPMNVLICPITEFFPSLNWDEKIITIYFRKTIRQSLPLLNVTLVWTFSWSFAHSWNQVFIRQTM